MDEFKIVKKIGQVKDDDNAMPRLKGQMNN